MPHTVPGTAQAADNKCFAPETSTPAPATEAVFFGEFSLGPGPLKIVCSLIQRDPAENH